MGTYRYILAVLVLLSHYGISFYGYNQGVSAVISFFLISGYVITLMIKKYYSGYKGTLFFYVDRILRLFPQFIFYLLTTLLLLAYFDDLNIPKDILKIVVNIMMLPLNFFTCYNDHFLIVPQAWSLGLEMQFYLLIPFILSLKTIRKSIAISLCFFLIAYLQIVNADYFGYRMITGTLFIFLIGSLLADWNENKKFILFIYGIIIILFIFSITIERLCSRRMTEVLLGILIGLPIIYALIKANIKSNIDLFMGNLSYGLYLNHMLISYIMKKQGVDISNPKILVLAIFLSTLLSYVSYKLIEMPCHHLRHVLRKKE